MPKSIYALDRKKNLYLKETRARGRGLFCTSKIRKGEELEATPAIILTEDMTKNVDKTILGNYVFKVGDISKKLQKRVGIKTLEKTSCVIMGITSFCNHDENPNAVVVWEQRGGTLYHVLQATNDIPKDTEICTSYGENWFNGRKEY